MPKTIINSQPAAVTAASSERLIRPSPLSPPIALFFPISTPSAELALISSCSRDVSTHWARDHVGPAERPSSVMKSIQPIKCLLRCGASRSLATVPGVNLTQQPEEGPSPDRRKESFLHKDLEIERALPWQMEKKPDNSDQLKFGHHFADHMMEVDWSEGQGWTRPAISPVHDFRIHPGAKVLHYAIQLFEGMKAYRGVDNRIRMFRPDMNMARMRRTAARSALPDFDGEELLKIIFEMVRLDKEWVPYSTTSSLYLRPTLIGTDPTLGVAHSRNAKLFVLSGPVGSFFHTGYSPVSLFADPNVVRAFPGGVGSFKMGCNYAPTIMVGKVAAKYGCQQVLWLSGRDEKLTEVGSMNIFIFWKNEKGEQELVTPPLTDGLILPGVTRDSVLTLTREWNEFQISERYLTMDELKQAIAEGRMLQMFGAGTACAVCPIGRIVYADAEKNHMEELLIPTMESGADLMQRIYEAIVDIQYGRTDRPEWVRIVD